MQRVSILKFTRKDAISALLKFAEERGDQVPSQGTMIELISDARDQHGSHSRVALEWIERDYE